MVEPFVAERRWSAAWCWPIKNRWAISFGCKRDRGLNLAVVIAAR